MLIGLAISQLYTGNGSICWGFPLHFVVPAPDSTTKETHVFVIQAPAPFVMGSEHTG